MIVMYCKTIVNMWLKEEYYKEDNYTFMHL